MTPEQRARLVKLMTYLTDQRAWWSAAMKRAQQYERDLQSAGTGKREECG